MPAAAPPSMLGSLIFGAALLLSGAGLLWREAMAWRQLQQATHTPSEVVFLRQRGGRRAQVAWMMVLIGVLIPLGDFVPFMANRPRLWAMHWLLILLLVLWMVLLAMLDMVRSWQHQREQLASIRRAATELQREAYRLRAQDSGFSPEHN